VSCDDSTHSPGPHALFRVHNPMERSRADNDANNHYQSDQEFKEEHNDTKSHPHKHGYSGLPP
jgi:hypothetical protein